MYNRRYDKVFVMLHQETAGFNFGGKSAWGSAAMEIRNGKGNIILSLAELKSLPTGREYALYLIGGAKGESEALRCDIITLDNYGRGKLQWEFNPDNIAGSGLTAEDLHTIAILVEGRDNNGLVAPLVGYYGDTINWKKRFRLFREKEEIGEAAGEAVREIQEEVKEETGETAREVAREIQEEVKEEIGEMAREMQEEAKEKIGEMAREMQEEVKEEMGEMAREMQEEAKEEIGEMAREIQEEIEGEIEEEMEEEIQEKVQEVSACECIATADSSNFHNNFKEMMVKFNKELTELQSAGILTEKDRARIDEVGKPKAVSKTIVPDEQLNYICTQNTAIEPFEEDDRQWRCLAIEELAVLPVDFLAMMRQPFLIHPYRKYKHFIFGWNQAGDSYLGVPNRYQPENRRLAEGLGFQTFLPCKNEILKLDAMGYWLYEIGKQTKT